MKSKIILCFFTIILVFATAQTSIFELKNNFKNGLHYFDIANPTAKTDQKALYYFEKIAKIEPKNNAEAVVICQAMEKSGVLNQTLENTQKASFYYKKALNIVQKHHLVDSLAFPSLLYLSGIYYYNSAYDSCLNYLSKAEIIFDKNPNLHEAERLFNTKGVLLFESGNFRQSLAYFKKAESLEGTDVFSNQNNQAQAWLLLNQPDSTYKILKKLQKDFPDETSLKINLASVLLQLNQQQKALTLLEKMPESELRFNTLGKIYFKLKNLPKAQENFEKVLLMNKTKNANSSFSHYYLGQILAIKNQDFEALNHFQLALQNLDFFFNNSNIYANPSNFSKGFYSFSMLDILFHKAKSFENLYIKTSKKNYLDGAISTFEALKSLANNISKTYNQEEARLDILDEIHPKFQSYTSMLWKVYQQTKEKKYAIKAFEVSEEGKAAVLALSINENQMKNNSDIPADLLREEKNLQITFSALKKKLESSTIEQKKHLIAINETQIKIGKLNEKLEQFPSYKYKKYEEQSRISLQKIQENLSKNEVVVSYADLGNSALVFALKKKEFFGKEVTNKKLLDVHLKKLNAEISKKLSTSSNKYIFDQIFKPFEQIFDKNSNLIFVGEELTNGLPIELLIVDDGQYLVEKYPISYLYSTKFLIDSKQKKGLQKILAFAPFSDAKSLKDFLPNSKIEIEKIARATTFISENASKKVFLENCQSFDILHLATHAVSDLDFPEKSFVRFSNMGKNQSDDKLYLFEFSAGMLKKTSLVFLSACDSYGKNNIPGEGIRGLSRGFYLAGSQSIISSLWQAEDFTTAYLTNKFYEHLEDGNSFPKSLQLAKIDLLHDPKMAQFKNPKYWSHLVYVGYQKQEKQWFENYLVYLFATIILVICIVFLKRYQFLSAKIFNFNK